MVSECAIATNLQLKISGMVVSPIKPKPQIKKVQTQLQTALF